MRSVAVAGTRLPMSFSTSRRMALPGPAATIIPQIPPSEVPTQSTGPSSLASRCASATT